MWNENCFSNCATSDDCSFLGFRLNDFMQSLVPLYKRGASKFLSFITGIPTFNLRDSNPDGFCEFKNSTGNAQFHKYLYLLNCMPLLHHENSPPSFTYNSAVSFLGARIARPQNYSIFFSFILLFSRYTVDKLVHLTNVRYFLAEIFVNIK